MGAIVLDPTEKFDLLVAVPADVATEILPVVAPSGTPVTIVVFDITVKLALTPLKATFVAPLKLVPVMVTAVPTLPEVGVKLEMTGGITTVKELLLVAIPPGVVTEIKPLVAPVGTVTFICVAESTVKVDAVVPLNVTAVVPVKFVPVTITAVPALPDPGVKPVMIGRGEVTTRVTVVLAVAPAAFLTIT